VIEVTDTGFAPWFVVKTNDKRRGRLNLITHLLEQIPYKQAPREKVKVPESQKAGKYRDPDYLYKFVPERF